MQSPPFKLYLTYFLFLPAVIYTYQIIYIIYVSLSFLIIQIHLAYKLYKTLVYSHLILAIIQM